MLEKQVDCLLRRSNRHLARLPVSLLIVSNRSILTAEVAALRQFQRELRNCVRHACPERLVVSVERHSRRPTRAQKACRARGVNRDLGATLAIALVVMRFAR